MAYIMRANTAKMFDSFRESAPDCKKLKIFSAGPERSEVFFSRNKSTSNKMRILDFLPALYDKSLNAILIPLFGGKTMLIYSCPSVMINGVSERQPRRL